MNNVLKMTEVIPASREEVFKYWTNPRLLEKWAHPKGMTLKIPLYDARTGGKYRYEHFSPEGRYLCTGHFQEYIPEHKLVHVDKVVGPEDNVIFQRIESIITFTETHAGTQVTVVQSGFEDEASMNECEIGWRDSFDNLLDLLGRERFRPGQELRSHQVRGE